MNDYEARTIAMAVSPKGQPIYSEMTTEVRIVDESGGEFVEVEQSGRADVGKIMINPEEWPALRGAVDRMIADCRSDK
jgi:hypothetical protein